jgi:hypothetical protein
LPVVSEHSVEIHRDRPFSATSADEALEPVDDSREPVLESGHESNVHDESHEPCDPPGQPYPMGADDRAAAVYGGHAPEVPILPGSRLGAMSDALFNDVSGMETGLKRDLGNAREVVVVHHVTDDEDLRVAGQRAVRLYLDAAGSVAPCASGVRQDLRQWRCRDTSDAPTVT